MMQFIYGSAIIVSLVYLCLLMSLYRKHISSYYILLCVSIILVSLGYQQISSAATLDAAMAGNQLVYLAASFVTFFMLHCIAELCHTRIPTIVNVLCIAVSLFIFACVMTADKSDLYYKSVQLIQIHDVSFLKKEYGPLHNIYPISVIVMLTYGIIMVLFALHKNRETSRSTSIMSLIIMAVTAGVYIAERLFRSEIEWMPVAYTVCFGIILVMLNRVKLYDLRGFSGDEIVSGESVGFVLLADDGSFEGADTFARSIFPELNHIRIDEKIKDESTPFLKQLGSWVRKEDLTPVQLFETDDRYIEASYSLHSEHFSRKVHSIRIWDDTKDKQYQNLIEHYNSELTQEVNKKTEKILQVQDDIIISMASIVENRDNNTGGHIQRTSSAVKVFTKHLLSIGYDNLTQPVASCIIKAAPLHDFGKIAIPDSILNKPGRFQPEEYEKMKEHSAKGSVIVSRILQNVEDTNFRDIAVNVAHYHHERWDGTGYPDKLVGTQIPFEARIMALADVFDALVSKRVYKDQFSYEEAFSIIEEGSGSQFDPNLCREFLACRPVMESLYNSLDRS